MKKMSFILKFIVAFIVATFAVALCIRYDASDNVVVCTYFGVTLMVLLALGAFDMGAIKRNMKHTSIKDAARYGQAAIFVGTAAIFVGTPKECEDVADDLWHYGQQVHVDTLTGDETFEIL
jgi:hypothetical protein